MPSRPNVNRGTLILLAPNATDAESSKNLFFAFQYNPEKLTHTFSQNSPQATNANSSMQGPAEFFNLTIELDSADVYVGSQNKNSQDFGLHPALAALELMMQLQTIGKQTFLPIVVFKWGAKRSVAVSVVNVGIDEKSFDSALNPTRATVSLTLRVLGAGEIGNNPGGRRVCLSHQNMRLTLVNAYRLQTGQGPVAVVGEQSKLAGSAAAKSSVESKTKVKA